MKMTDEKYAAHDWPDRMDWLSFESDVREVLRDYFRLPGQGVGSFAALVQIDKLVEYYTGRGSARD
jgi:hypothetical protein